MGERERRVKRIEEEHNCSRAQRQRTYDGKERNETKPRTQTKQHG